MDVEERNSFYVADNTMVINSRKNSFEIMMTRMYMHMPERQEHVSLPTMGE